MQERVCVVTRGNGGIGRATALALAKLGARVIILSHPRERGERARAEIAEERGNDKIELAPVDFATQADVRRVAAELLQKHEKIHVLINNAAVCVPERELTVEDVEKTFATNYLSHFLLTNLLLERLKASAPARVVNVATLIRGAELDLDDLMPETGASSGFAALGSSKLAFVLFTRELAKRLAGTGVTVNALFPGLVRAELLYDSPWLMRTLFQLLSTTMDEGAQTAAFLASDPSIVGVTGKLFAKSGGAPMSGAQVSDEELSKRLWDRSTQLAELT